MTSVPDSADPAHIRWLAQQISSRLINEADIQVTACATLDAANPSHVSFLANAKYLDKARTSNAGAIICSVEHAEHLPGKTLLVADDPYFAFRQAMVLLHGWRMQPAVGVSPDAYVDDTAEFGDLCTIRPGAHVAPRAKIGNRVILYPGCYVGKDAVIGDDCVLYSSVTVYDRCTLGHRVTLHAGTSIGHDGFGYATHPPTEPPHDGSDPAAPIHHKIPQAGIAVLEDDVEMGANCSVDRATLGETRIGAGTKFSNNVVIGHGCTIGKHNLFVAHVGVAGSVTTGDYVVLGGQVGIAGHLSLGDRVQVAAGSKVMHDIPEGQQWGGAPAQPLTHTKRVILHTQRLPDLAAQIKRLTRRLTRLEKQQTDQ
ncbi:MAG: UDP-3-O-(3-hydroxymyristoyl)glucosamine N-acyltransferase [Planctomycetota bacterium]